MMASIKFYSCEAVIILMRDILFVYISNESLEFWGATEGMYSLTEIENDYNPIMLINTVIYIEVSKQGYILTFCCYFLYLWILINPGIPDLLGFAI